MSVGTLHDIGCKGPADCHCAVVYVVRETTEIERPFDYNERSVGMRGISTTHAESNRLTKPRPDLLIPGLAGASSFEESAE